MLIEFREVFYARDGSIVYFDFKLQYGYTYYDKENQVDQKLAELSVNYRILKILAEYK